MCYKLPLHHPFNNAQLNFKLSMDYARLVDSIYECDITRRVGNIKLFCSRPVSEVRVLTLFVSLLIMQICSLKYMHICDEPAWYLRPDWLPC